MTFKDKLVIYLVNKSNRIDNDYDNALRVVRWHSADDVELLETIIAKVRKDTFNEVMQDILTLLKLPEYNRK